MQTGDVLGNGLDIRIGQEAARVPHGAVRVVFPFAAPESVELLFLEASYAHTRPALLSLYRWFNWWVGTLLGPMILFWMNLYYRGGLDRLSPVRLAPSVTAPVMLIHGEKDRRFPLEYAYRLQKHFPDGIAEIFIARGSGHSDSSKTPGYAEAIKSFLDRHPQGL